VLIFANKQDTPNAKSVAELIQIYSLDKINTHTWHIQGCSAKTGEGLLCGLKWLSDQLVYKNTRFPKNPYIVEQYSKIEETSVRNNTSTILNNTVSDEMKKNVVELDSISDNLDMSK
jgi:hypothetical protein